MMPLMMLLNQVAGMKLPTTCSGTGILSRGKIKPESSIVGIISPSADMNMAVIWSLALVLIKMPSESATNMYNTHSAAKRTTEPSKGIPKTKIPSSMMTRAFTSVSAR